MVINPWKGIRMEQATRQAVWNSRKGYSRPGEIVDVIREQDGFVEIVSHADDDSDFDAGYWVLPTELAPVSTHDHRDRGDPMEKACPASQSQDWDTFGRPMRAGT